jgi:small-conductance mechanosensitive channel
MIPLLYNGSGIMALVAFLLALAFAQPALAAAPPPAGAAPSVGELEQLVETLRDDKARAALVTQLQALIAAQRTIAAETPEPADFLAGLSQRINALMEEVLAGVAVIVDAPRLVAWGRAQIANEAARARWIEVTLAFAIVFGLAFAAEWLVRWLFARLLRRAPSADHAGRGIQALRTGIAILVEVLPIAVFAVTALVALAMTVPPFTMARFALSILVEATITARLILAVGKSVLVPALGAPVLVPASEETRNYLLIWLRRFTDWTVFGYAVAAAAWWLGIPGGLYALMLKIVGLVVAILALVFILQNRVWVSRWITGEAPMEGGGWTRVRRRLGESWHFLAILYIVGIYLVYALRIEGGSGYILRATVLSLVVLAGARLLVRFVEQLSARGFAVAPELKARFPLLEQRANRYLPILTGLVSAAVYVLAALAVLQAWDFGSFGWFETGIGRRVTGGLLSIALVLAIALAAWEIFAVAIERHLAALDANGAPSRARRRTLLPLLRTTMLCVIVVIAALIILSQIGINIAPLLAGAGVVGLAIGFGSQALVKDIITGLFILIEDQIAVGDIVDVGKDHAGVVEAISMRTIRLRDQGGVVHTVPFSEVTSIKNMTKDYAYAVARIGIAYGEDIDRVVEILRGVCDELMADETTGPLILDPFDYQGVDRLDEFSVILLLRVRTLPGKQFSVGRALNQLIKIAFEKHGIAGRDPSPVLVTGPAAALAAKPAEDDAEAVVARAQRRSA